MKPKKFKVLKYKRSIPNALRFNSLDMGPRSTIYLGDNRVGHIISGTVYLYVKITEPATPMEKVLNYKPITWAVFPNHEIARKEVVNKTQQILADYKLYMPEDEEE